MSSSSQSSDGLPAVDTMDTNLDLLMPRNQPSTLTENDWTKDKECAVSADDHPDDYGHDPSLLINRSDNSNFIIKPDDISRQNKDTVIKEDEILAEKANHEEEEEERVAEDLLMHEWTLQTFLIQSVLLLVVCVNCYFNSVQCDFVYDDHLAIIGNEDIRTSTPVWQIFKNDFWGTEITSFASHKSYRPLTVLTFRWNFALSGLEPSGFHFTNLILHWLLCVTFMHVFKLFLTEWLSFLLAMLFLVNPIHTESVTGVVGRADILFSMFAILAFWSYTKSASSQSNNTEWRFIWLTIVLTIISTLFKEQGITIIAVCCAYDVFWLHHITLWQGLTLLKVIIISPRSTPVWFRSALARMLTLIAAAAVLIATRIAIMGAALPNFSKYDNPASFTKWPTKQLTFAYLLPLNIWLLLFPYNLSCDYSGDVVPLVTSSKDPRNLATVNFLVALATLSGFALIGNSKVSRQVAMALSFLVFPFLPASNIFFSVGFVIAERILYLPSIGFSMLVVIGLQQILKQKKLKFFVYFLLIVTISLHAARTARRNIDWSSRRSLFRSGLLVSRQNAKLWINFGHTYENNRQYEEALCCFNSSLRSVYAVETGALTELGRIYMKMQNDEMALEYLKKSQLALEPLHKDARYSKTYVDSWYFMGQIKMRNESTWGEAENNLKRTIMLNKDKVDAYLTLSQLYLSMNKTNNAMGVLGAYLKVNPKSCKVLMKLADILIANDRLTDAQSVYESCIHHEPENKKAQGKLFDLIDKSKNTSEYGKYDLIASYIRRLEDSQEDKHYVHIKLGDLYRQVNNYDKAIYHLSQSLLVDPNHRSVLTSIALVYMARNDTDMAYHYLQRLIEAHPHDAKGWLFLGYYLVDKRREFDSGRECLLRAIELDPTDSDSHYNLCVIHARRNERTEALHCLEELLTRFPSNDKFSQAYDTVLSAVLTKASIG